ncbi:cell envelope integrity protein TolA [Cryobacterium psychrophilum]|uniref:DUF2510 domain-containing protein n=1 Tax=Cryobacterium psychrophilum TaxID=41988 RepID=A0A4Y8KU54_9MICO|nr:cell envelope integrity protein TolA [Cryobacterium psychrophilum]TDW30355.1 hypothetical protein EDD25_2106 [Cryobacterium psychrophilum]TFD79050.1 DUF2510 domain-containing protein [Cryobacterium psychrophilum]
MTDLPNGFYTGPDGHERFWDGSEWHDSPNHPPAAQRKSGPIKKFKALKTRTRVSIIVLAAVIVLSGIGGAIVAIASHNQEIAAAELAETQKIAAEELAQKQEDERVAAKAKAGEADLERRRDNRAAAVSDIEASVKEMADGHAADGIIEGPILSVRCTTTGGISIDDISIRSMLFECFASNAENEDGTSTGFYYNARADWDNESWTYGLGRG